MKPRGAIELLEEAVALLRSADASVWAVYLAGAVPFTLAMLFFFTDMARNPFASEWLPAESLGLALLFLWKCVWQALFAARLYRLRSASTAKRSMTSSTLARLILVQCALQPWSLPLQPLAMLVTIPFAWVVAFFRNAGMFAALGRADFMLAARRQSGLWTRQNWNMLGLATVASLFVFANALILILLLPQLALSVLGIESDLSRLGIRLLNPTSVAVAAMATWLVVDPLLEAAYVLRCFYGEAMATGEDLRIALRQLTGDEASQARQKVGVAALVIGLLFVAPAGKAQPPAQVQTVDAARLEQAIDQTVRQREFAWRAKTPAGPEPTGRWVGWVRSGLQMVQNAADWLAKKLGEWFKIRPEEEGKGAGASRLPLELWMGLAGLFLAGAVVAALLRFRKTRVVEAEASEAAAAAPDLRDESILADQLPEASWLALAEEWLAKGDCRLAMRALYLAGLNYLNARRLISLQRSKTGHEYRRELDRRSRQNPAVASDIGAVFLESVAMFEKGWYGRHTMARPDVEALARGFEEVRRRAG